MRLDGERLFGLGAYRPYFPPHLEAYQRLAGVGVRQFQCDTTCAEDIYHPELRFWHGPDDFGSQEQERQFARLLEIEPDALLQLRVFVGCPDWWLDLHPNECQTYADGANRCSLQRTEIERVPSLASKVWRQDICHAMRRYVRWLVERGWSKHVSSLFICYGITWEWGILGSDCFPDYSPNAERYFREWLRTRYGNGAALSASWGRSVEVDQAVIPSKDRRLAAGKGLGRRPVPEFQDVVDHQLCLSDMNADVLLAVAKAAREESAGQVPIGAFYGYTLTAREQTLFTGQYGAGGFQGGHHALGRVLRSPDIDFLASPFTYVNRDLGTGLLFEHVPLASVHAHGKAFFDENDLYTHTNQPIMDDRLSGISVGIARTPEETIRYARLAFMQAIVRGKHSWFTDLTGWIGDIGENYSDPDLLEEIRRLNALGEMLIQRERGAVVELAFVLDEESVAYLSLDNTSFRRCVYEMLPEWGHLATPFDVILLDDLPNDGRYKLIVPACIKSPQAIARFQAWERAHPGVATWWDGSLDCFPPCDPVAFLPELQLAGVHRYSEASLTVWANASMVGVHNSHEGRFSIVFKQPCRGLEAFSGSAFEAPEGTLEWTFGKCDVVLFVME